MVRLIGKEVNEEISGCSTADFSKIRIVKNVFILCLAFFITFTAYECVNMLQSTLNHIHGIGAICQATFFGCSCFSSLFLPKYTIKKLGCKLTLVLSMSLFLPYIASNLHPEWFFMVPAAVFNGLSAPLLWGALCQYLNEISMQYATLNTYSKSKKEWLKSESVNLKTISDKINPEPEIKFVITDCSEYDKQNVTNVEKKDTFQKLAYNVEKENTTVIPGVDLQENTFSNNYFGLATQETTPQKNIESITARFFGIHGLAHLSTTTWSNLMSYFILRSNDIHSNITVNSSCTCGADFCNVNSVCLVQNLQEPSLENRYLLFGICLALGLVSIIITALFLDSLNDKDVNATFSLHFLLATSKQLKKVNQILLSPISFYTGMVKGFYVADFNLSFVGCTWGTSHVALVGACYGAACGLSSYVSGWLIKLTGRVPIFSFAAVVNVSAQILLLLWTPSTEDTVVFFIVAMLWGTTVGIFFSQVKVMHGLLFKRNQEASFGAYDFWYSLGFCLSLAYHNHLCTNVKIYVLLFVLILSFVGYLSVELLLKFNNKMSAE